MLKERGKDPDKNNPKYACTNVQDDVPFPSIAEELLKALKDDLINELVPLVIARKTTSFCQKKKGLITLLVNLSNVN